MIDALRVKITKFLIVTLDNSIYFSIFATYRCIKSKYRLEGKLYVQNTTNTLFVDYKCTYTLVTSPSEKEGLPPLRAIQNVSFPLFMLWVPIKIASLMQSKQDLGRWDLGDKKRLDLIKLQYLSDLPAGLDKQKC